ncbi:MAG: 5-keto-L-gluconate epimerase [Candidatus Marinimicrobia bacterium]|nr:5-keto-L-gluconate epimerase [Candidatus Neomarinimicrobiota bacterium]
MKLSIVISTQPAKFSALAYKGKLAENIAKIKALGYDGVELAIRDPKLLDIAMLESLLVKYEFPVVAIGTGQAYGEEGLSFTSPEEAIRRSAIERIKSQIHLAERLKSFVIIGLIRGNKRPETDAELTTRWLIEAMQECATENPGVRLVIEPCNRYETNIINTVDEGLEFLKTLAQPNVGLLLDTFHMNIEEANMLASIGKAGSRLFHFHIADSNRWHPGTGHIDFKAVVDRLKKIGYTGYLSAEILPLPDSDIAAKNTSEYMHRLIK